MQRIFVLAWLAILPWTTHSVPLLGGSDVKAGEASFAASILYKDSLFCGGALISSQLVITAASCVSDGEAEGLYVALGDVRFDKASRFKVNRVIFHEEYDSIEHSNNIAVLLIDKVPNSITPLAITKAEPKAGITAKAFGRGATTKDNVPKPISLQYVSGQMLDRETCESEASGVNPITKDMICVATKDQKGPCKGDIGDPLVNEAGELIGIYSWDVFDVECGKRTADPRIAVATNVVLFRDWIKMNTGILEGLLVQES